MAMYPAAVTDVLHTTVDSLRYTAGTIDALKRQSSAPVASAAHEKPLPPTVTGVPPSITPPVGDTDDTVGIGW
jgi:hypothetical protein